MWSQSRVRANKSRRRTPSQMTNIGDMTTPRQELAPVGFPNANPFSLRRRRRSNENPNTRGTAKKGMTRKGRMSRPGIHS